MKTKSFFLLTALALLTFCGIFSSCSSKSDDILDKIPAESAMVMKMDLKFWVEQSGIKFGSDGLEFPEYLKPYAESLTPETIADLLKFEKAVDLSNVYFVMNELSGDAPWIMVKLNDPSQFEKIINEDDNKITEYNGFKLIKNASCIVKDGFVWIVVEGNLEKSADKIADALAEAEKSPISQVKAASEALTSGTPMNFVLNYNSYLNALTSLSGMKMPMPEMIKDAWATVRISTKGSSLTTDFAMVKADGSPVELPQSDEIDSPVLNYVPADFNFVAAVGKPSEEAVDNAITSLKSVQEFQMFLPVFEKFIKAIDGTSIFAAGAQYPSFYVNPDLSNWNFLVMIHMDQATVNECVSNITQLAAGYGLGTAKEVKEGLYMIELEGRTFYFGNVDGYLTLSTVMPVNTNTNPLSKYLIGHQQALALSIPRLDGIRPTLPDFSILVTAQSEPEASAKMVCTLDGTEDNFVTTIVKIFCK